MRRYATYLKAAFLAAKVLRNPKDIFALLRLGDLLTDTASTHLAVERLRRDPETAKRINERATLVDFPVAKLADYPAGTLGGDFHSHVVRHGLDFYVSRASEAANDREYVRERVRETHDILHAVLNYDISIAEEAGVNAFLAAQSALPISTLIVAGALLHSIFKAPAELPAVLDKIAEGYRLGKQSRSMLGVEWELAFSRPTAEIRQHLGISSRAPITALRA